MMVVTHQESKRKEMKKKYLLHSFVFFFFFLQWSFWFLVVVCCNRFVKNTPEGGQSRKRETLERRVTNRDRQGNYLLLYEAVSPSVMDTLSHSASWFAVALSNGREGAGSFAMTVFWSEGTAGCQAFYCADWLIILKRSVITHLEAAMRGEWSCAWGGEGPACFIYFFLYFFPPIDSLDYSNLALGFW